VCYIVVTDTYAYGVSLTLCKWCKLFTMRLILIGQKRCSVVA